MMQILHHLWPSLALAGAFGLVFGWLSRSAGPMPRIGRLAAGLAGIGLVVAGAVALLGLVPARAGFWLDSAVLHAVAYLAGGCLGWAAARLVQPSAPAVTGSAR